MLMWQILAFHIVIGNDDDDLAYVGRDLPPDSAGYYARARRGKAGLSA